ncbi:MAG: transposase [Acidimicrobiales bacterium]
MRTSTKCFPAGSVNAFLPTPNRSGSKELVNEVACFGLRGRVSSAKAQFWAILRDHQWPEVQRALWREHFWSPSHAVMSCGGASLGVMKAYVKNQRSPNRNPGRPKKFAS